MRRHLDYDHTPTRGSAVEKWLQTKRDEYAKDPHSYGPRQTVEQLLSDYRLRADEGRDLDYDFEAEVS